MKVIDKEILNPTGSAIYIDKIAFLCYKGNMGGVSD